MNSHMNRPFRPSPPKGTITVATRVLFVCDGGENESTYREAVRASGLEVTFVDADHAISETVKCSSYDYIFVDSALQSSNCGVVTAMLRDRETIKGQLQTPIVKIDGIDDLRQQVSRMTSRRHTP